jgi:hypothetical protein
VDASLALQSTLFDVEAVSSKHHSRSSSSRANDMRSRRMRATHKSHRRRRFLNRMRRVETLRSYGKSDMPDFSFSMGQLFQMVTAVSVCDMRVASEVLVSFLGSVPYSITEQIMSNISKILVHPCCHSMISAAISNFLTTFLFISIAVDERWYFSGICACRCDVQVLCVLHQTHGSLYNGADGKGPSSPLDFGPRIWDGRG